MQKMIMKAETDNYLLRIFRDDAPVSPRAWDNLGTMVCWHRNYELGDKHNYRNVEEWINDLADSLGITLEYVDYDDYKHYKTTSELFDNIKQVCVVLPLYLYDHSGITMSTFPFNCPWDSGQVGWIYVTHDKIKEEYGKLDDETIKRVKDVLIGEVKVYDQYLNNDVYGYVLENKIKCDCCGHIEYNLVDSCWGYYGIDGIKSFLKEELSNEFTPLIEKLEFVC